MSQSPLTPLTPLPPLDTARQQAELRVAKARREAELKMAEMRTAVETEVGFLTGKKHFLMLLAAGAGGFALALRRGRSRKQLRGRRR